jgi:hypothetical protein
MKGWRGKTSCILFLTETLTTWSYALTRKAKQENNWVDSLTASSRLRKQTHSQFYLGTTKARISLRNSTSDTTNSDQTTSTTIWYRHKLSLSWQSQFYLRKKKKIYSLTAREQENMLLTETLPAGKAKQEKN